MLRAIAFLCVLASSLAAQALNPFEQNFDEQLSQLKERVHFYSSNYPDIQVPDDLTTGKLAELGGGGPATHTVQRKLRGLIDRMDRLVLGPLKKEIYAIGTRVKSDPTTAGNFYRRGFLLNDFAGVLKRQRIPMLVYFPKGDKPLAVMKMGGDEAYKAADEIFNTLTSRLREEMEGGPVAGGGGGGGGGGSKAGGGEGGGGLTGFEEPPPSVAPATRRPAPPPETEVTWMSRFKVTVGIGVVAVVVCSLLALLLPRVRAGMFTLLRRLATGGKAGADPMADDDALKKALLALNRGDYRKALSLLDRVTGPMRAPEVTYHRATCTIRLLSVEEAARQLTLLELDRTGLEEIFRLASLCEEVRMLEWAIRLYEHLLTRDAHFRGVAAKVERLKREAVTRA